MKSYGKTVCFLSALVTGLSLLCAVQVPAQTFTTLHSFTAFNNSTNSDGGNPYAGLVVSGNVLYGTTYQGGSSSNGTVFKVNTDGSGFTILHTFTPLSTSFIVGTNSDGANPYAGLVLSGNTLYGTAVNGGSSAKGVVFRVNTDGTGFTNLYNFTTSFYANPQNTNTDGANPHGRLVLSGNVLYGTAKSLGHRGLGTVFKVNTDGTGFTHLHSFESGAEGQNPVAGLALSGNTLYGTTFAGGSWSQGTVFKVNTDGTGFSNLHTFTGTANNAAVPYDGLIISSNTLYGTAMFGGTFNKGSVFKVNTNGTGFSNLYSFTVAYPDGTNYGGNFPRASLSLSGRTLYGTATSGGSSGSGTVFAIKTDGTGFTNLHSFSPLTTDSDGAIPFAGLAWSDHTLYGTTYFGGYSGNGTVFRISLPAPPQLTLIRSGSNVILTWPTNATGFALQSAPSITGTFTNITGATTPYTNTITGSQRYFRLISN